MVDRKPQTLIHSASDVDPKTIDDRWRLGNVHNFDELVCVTGLFANNLTANDRKLFSPSLTRFGIDTAVALDFAIECGKRAADLHNWATSTADGRDMAGVFRFREHETDSGNRDEQRLSLTFTSSFNEFLRLLSIQDASGAFARAIGDAREAFDDAKNPQDFVVFRRLSSCTLPVVLFEFSNGRGSTRNYRKEPQVFSYACNNQHSLPDDKSMLSMGVTICGLSGRKPTFQVFGYYRADATNTHVVPLTDELDMTADNLSNLFYATVAFTLSITLDTLPSMQCRAVDMGLRFPSGAGGVVKLDHSRVKVFNYALFARLKLEFGGSGRVVPAERRTWTHAVKMLDNARHLRLHGNIDMLVYNDVVGGPMDPDLDHKDANRDHQPSHSSCFAACIQQLKQAHDQDILHCELHIRDFVFNQADPSKSRIIDWDFSRPKDEPGVYVRGWQKLNERHSDAIAGSAIMMSHERYSLGAVMLQATPADDVHGKTWADICEMAGNEEVELAVVLERLTNLECDLVPSDLLPQRQPTTGSPEREAALRPLTEATKKRKASQIRPFPAAEHGITHGRGEGRQKKRRKKGGVVDSARSQDLAEGQ